jgi:hypothetical protein
MNILFMIGNGFDLGMGLKTKFTDFFPEYEKINKSNDPAIVDFKQKIKENYETWADFEIALGRYASKFKTFPSDFAKTVMSHCHEDFVDAFADYLEEQQSQLHYDSKASEIATVFERSILRFHETLCDESKKAFQKLYDVNRNQRVCNFITFNYTEVLGRCLKFISPTPHRRIGEVLHIHGTLKDGMLIGVDNPSQIENDELNKDDEFVSLLSKPLTNSALGNFNNANAKKLINDSSIICIFGMSLGKTDKTWWREVGQWLLGKPERQLVVLNYVPNYNKRLPRKTIESENQIRERFFEAAELAKAEREVCKKRIHVGINTDVFKITLPKKEPVPMHYALTRR